MTIGEKICKLRNSESISQKELVLKIGAFQSAVNFWENRKRQPRLEQLQRLAAYFDVTLDSLITDKDSLQEENILNLLFGNYYNLDDGIADIHFASEEFTLEELEKIYEYAEFLKSQRRKTEE